MTLVSTLRVGTLSVPLRGALNVNPGKYYRPVPTTSLPIAQPKTPTAVAEASRPVEMARTIKKNTQYPPEGT